jgi:hypothetical protein
MRLDDKGPPSPPREVKSSRSSLCFRSRVMPPGARSTLAGGSGESLPETHPCPAPGGKTRRSIQKHSATHLSGCAHSSTPAYQRELLRLNIDYTPSLWPSHVFRQDVFNDRLTTQSTESSYHKPFLSPFKIRRLLDNHPYP